MRKKYSDRLFKVRNHNPIPGPSGSRSAYPEPHTEMYCPLMSVTAARFHSALASSKSSLVLMSGRRSDMSSSNSDADADAAAAAAAAASAAAAFSSGVTGAERLR